jgi:hypothetical protein
MFSRREPRAEPMTCIEVVGAKSGNVAVRGARIEGNRTDEGARLTRLVLDTEDGIAALEYGYGSSDRAAQETAVNEWLTRPVS